MPERAPGPDLYIARADSDGPEMVRVSPRMWNQLEVDLSNRGSYIGEGDKKKWVPNTSITIDEFDAIAGNLQHSNGEAANEAEIAAMFEQLQAQGTVSLEEEKDREDTFHIAVGGPIRPRDPKKPGAVIEMAPTRKERLSAKEDHRNANIANGLDQFIEAYPVGWTKNVGKVALAGVMLPLNGKRERRQEQKDRAALEEARKKRANWDSHRQSRLVIQPDPDELEAFAKSRSEYIRASQGHGGGHVVRGARERDPTEETTTFDTHRFVKPDLLATFDPKYLDLFANGSIYKLAGEVKRLASKKREDDPDLSVDDALTAAEREVFESRVEGYGDTDTHFKDALSAARRNAQRDIDSGSSRPTRSDHDSGPRRPGDRDDSRGPRSRGSDRSGSSTPDGGANSGPDSTTDPRGSSRGGPRPAPRAGGGSRGGTGRSGGSPRSGGPATGSTGSSS